MSAGILWQHDTCYCNLIISVDVSGNTILNSIYFKCLAHSTIDDSSLLTVIQTENDNKNTGTLITIADLSGPITPDSPIGFTFSAIAPNRVCHIQVSGVPATAQVLQISTDITNQIGTGAMIDPITNTSGGIVTGSGITPVSGIVLTSGIVVTSGIAV